MKESDLLIQEEQEKKLILNAYKGLLRATQNRNKRDNVMIRKAFNVANEAHKEMRRKTGEPYITHPIAVARICAEEIGLGPTSVVCALLHDTVEDTYITSEDIKQVFGPKVQGIIDGLTKISSVSDYSVSVQAENFKKMLLTLSDDVRVILIKFADRLHNMRTLGSMRRDKQLKIASETLYLYAPLAHRLGLNKIKTEFEELSFAILEPDIAAEITAKMDKSRDVRERFIRKFSNPIKKTLKEMGLNFTIKGRPKSAYSIYKKMKKKDIPFEEVYDLFAIRIILNSELNDEKTDCWRTYSAVTDFYMPNPDRLRDWISTPKANGYEALHTTVMSPTGKWVEVQIRSERMDQIAERGYAAHWKYKDASKKNESKGLDDWLNKIRELLERPHNDAMDFIDDFQLNLFSDEIFVFTPKGELVNLPTGATILDFAFEIHTKLGAQCIGAKVNHQLVPLSHILKNGDQIDIITSSKQVVKEEWLKFVVTQKAKSKLKSLIRERRKKFSSSGQEIYQKLLKKYKLLDDPKNTKFLLRQFQLPSENELWYRLANESLNLSVFEEAEIKKGFFNHARFKHKDNEEVNQFLKSLETKKEIFYIGEEGKNYSLAKCCNPIPGDEVFGIITMKDGVVIHRNSCPNSTQILSKYGTRAVRAKWFAQKSPEFTVGLAFKGIDGVGLLNKITLIISEDLNVNMKSLNFEGKEGVFEGRIYLQVHDTSHLDLLTVKLMEIEGLISVQRLQN